MHEFCLTKITYSSEQKNELNYSCKTLHWSVNFKISVKIFTGEQMNKIGDYGVSASKKSAKVQTPQYTKLNSQTNHENQLKITTPKNPIVKTG